MKRGTVNHPKVSILMAELGINRKEAVGLLTILWEWTGDYAPQGDIGRWDDATIARIVDYGADEAAKLVRALVNSGFIDEHKKYRLVIHDWHDHAESYVRKRLERNKLPFLTTAANGSQRQPKSDNGSQRQPRARACPSPSPSLNPSPDINGGSPAFDGWWARWPSGGRKEEKAKCLSHWKANKLDDIADEVLAGLVRWKGSDEWAADDGKFIPAPIVWLRKTRWTQSPKPAEWDGTGMPPEALAQRLPIEEVFAQMRRQGEI